MRDGDRGTNPLGVLDDGLALVDQLLDDAADPALVLAIGAIQRRDLVVDERLQLAGPAERALDGLAHRVDLLADRLAGGDRALLGDLGGVGNADCDAGHHVGDIADLGRPARERGDAEENGYRQQDAENERQGRLLAQERCDGRTLRDPFSEEAPADGGAHHEPEQRKAGGDPDWRRGRPGLQLGIELAEVALVVSGPTWRAGLARAGCGLAAITRTALRLKGRFDRRTADLRHVGGLVGGVRLIRHRSPKLHACAPASQRASRSRHVSDRQTSSDQSTYASQSRESS